jgi:plasmid maintenance system antidote protein VapI
MSKRNLEIIETWESKLLKRLRVDYGISIRKLADLMELSPTRVMQFEVGRETVTTAYISKFLNVLGISSDTWTGEMTAMDPLFQKKESCKKLIDELDKSKLDVVFNFLKSFKDS